MLLFPASYRSLGLNGHLNADGTPNAAYAQDTVTIDSRSLESAYREGRDSYHLSTGGSLGRVHKGARFIRLSGRVIAPNTSQTATISDRERAMLAAFDPYLCYLASPSTDGAHAFDFTEATADTTTYPTGRIALRYYCRPAGQPSMTEALSESVRRYALTLVAADPRCYEQAEQTLTLTSGSPSGSLVNRGTFPTPLKAVVTMSGTGAANFTLSVGSRSLVLDLSSSTAGTVWTVVTDTCAHYGTGRSVLKDGSSAFSKKTSGATTWPEALAGTQSASISNATGVTSCVLSWRSARA